MSRRKLVHLIGCPLDLGAARRGTDMAPSAMRLAGLARTLAALGYTVEDRGNVPVPQPESRDVSGERAKFLDEIMAACRLLADEVAASVAAGAVPVVLGGDHSAALGTVPGLARCYRRLGLLWVDAHGDFNTPESSPSGNVHGMPLAALMGRGDARLVAQVRQGDAPAPARTVIVGARALDVQEKRLILDSGITCFTMNEVDRFGVAEVMRRAGEHWADCDGVHVSLDLDALDPRDAPGVGTPVRGGLTYREAHVLLEIMAEEHRVAGLDLVEVNPVLDERNRTAETAVELAASALGARILPRA